MSGETSNIRASRIQKEFVLMDNCADLKQLEITKYESILGMHIRV